MDKDIKIYYKHKNKNKEIIAEPIRRGRWVYSDIVGSYYCSLCRQISAKIICETRYCCYCGALMDDNYFPENNYQFNYSEKEAE